MIGAMKPDTRQFTNPTESSVITENFWPGYYYFIDK